MQRILKKNINILLGSNSEALIHQFRGIIEEFQISVRVVKCKDELMGLSRDALYHSILLDLDLYQTDEMDLVRKTISDK